MVYDHHNHYTVSIVYDYRPLEAFQKFFIIGRTGKEHLVKFNSYLYILT